MRGRPRKPTTIHRLNGTFRADRHRGKEMEGEPLRSLRAPSWLDKYGRACWKAHAPWLQKNGLLTSAEVFLFAAVCERWSTYRRAIEELKDGLLHTTLANGECSKPQVAIAKTAFDGFRVGLQEFGVSPISRSKVKVAETAAGDTFEKYFRSHPRLAAL